MLKVLGFAGFGLGFAFLCSTPALFAIGDKLTVLQAAFSL